MPKQQQTIELNDLDKEMALAISYQAIKNSGWEVLFAGEEKLLGSTPKKWSSFGQEIMIETDGITLTVSSEMVNGESFDIGGKNKKNIESFLTAFKTVQSTLDQEIMQRNIETIKELRVVTQKTAEQEAADAAALDAAMNLSGSNLYVTYGIIAINIIVFALMAINGAGLFDVNGLVHIRWGSNFSVLTLSGDWWRLLTNVFIHFGIIHLLMNMYCLYTVGVYLEPMLGKVKYIIAYLCTGVLASIVSLWWHSKGVNSAGASGAIFGMYGLFLALLTTNLIPKQVRNALLQSIGIFIGYNLLYGMKSGVDNSAHVGGLISGLAIGVIYAYAIKKEKAEQNLNWVLPAIILFTLGMAYEYLQLHKTSQEDRKTELAYIADAKYDDNEKFNDLLIGFSAIEDSAIAPLQDTTLNDPELKIKINSISYPSWKRVEAALEETKGYNISPAMHAKADRLLAYVMLREKELDVLLKIIDTGNQQEFIPELNEVRMKQKEATAELQ
ncbi:rhomboid family intramembrane serine protease [Ferruginibacter lapsinanis]|uniref:rhomboid family intramembrane serine protease n=1 Tax=Ferruginibacter lapsinanis TaxID=563172 RepID=UPI001E38209C|nr:rhomboid family intramembrane serine protease [Ferruginibacter lapsinanis]UEG48956.1 rhomboid family intramembrane serine protease [Ferruginibacter lapsinanis]